MDISASGSEDRAGLGGGDMAGEPESLDTDETLERRRHRHWLDRLIMLSDGVFAIAATLLSLDVRGPAQWSTLGELWAGLGPQLGAYVLSFLVIAVYWLAHRRFMSMVTTVDAPLTVLTLIMLGLVALLPSLTRISFGRTRIIPLTHVRPTYTVVDIGDVHAQASQTRQPSRKEAQQRSGVLGSRVLRPLPDR